MSSSTERVCAQVAWVRRMESRGIQNYPKRFQSAEGCYSQKAVAAHSLRIKTSNKQAIYLTPVGCMRADRLLTMLVMSLAVCGIDCAVRQRHLLRGRVCVAVQP